MEETCTKTTYICKIKPKDIIAGLVIIGYFGCKIAKIESGMDGAFMLILGYYFVKRQNGEDKGL